jgi:hypothetical protein
MNSSRKTALIVGVAFIIATVAGVLGSFVFLDSIDAPGYLSSLSANENQVLIGMLIDLLMATAIIGIPFMLFPYLRRQNEVLAVGYVSARIVEGVVVIGGAISLLLLLVLSREFVAAGAPDASHFQTLGALLHKVRSATDAIGTQIVFSFTALLLNVSLFRSRLIPRLISGWGIIGAPIMFMAGVLGLVGILTPFSTISSLMYLPLALQEMVFAVWLVVKGFNASALALQTGK